MGRVIITCALTGAQQGKEKNQNLPVQPQEIIEQGFDAWKAGASILHIHARDKKGQATSDVTVFRRIVEGLREKGCDALLNLTTGGAVAGLPLEERLRIIPELKPEIASFSIGGGSLLARYTEDTWEGDRFVPLFNSYKEIDSTLKLFEEHRVKPELEVYNTAFLNNLNTFYRVGRFKDPLLVNFVMGIPGECTPAEPRNLFLLLEQVHPNAYFEWHVSAIGGRSHFEMIAAALALGGHVRTGMEDNVYIERGKLAKSNAELVEKVARMAIDTGRGIATPAQAREMLESHVKL